MEKVESIEDHRKHYIVIVLREVDEAGMATSHNHSIVIHVDDTHGKFDLENLMASHQGTDMESLNDEFIAKQLLPWQECSLRREEIAFSLANAGQIRYCQCCDGYHCIEGQQTAAPKRPLRQDHVQKRKRRILSWLFKSRGPKEKPCPIKGQRRGHSEEKQANWPREDGGRGRISLRCDDGADRDLPVHSSCREF